MVEVENNFLSLKNLVVSQPNTEDICQVCNDIIFNPVECQICKINVCLICAEHLTSSKKKCVNPISEKNHFMKFENNTEEKRNILFKCSNNGCGVEVNLNELASHLLRCSFLTQACPFKNCVYKGSGEEMKTHMKLCEFSKSVCYLCNEIISWENKNSHNCLSKFVEEMIKLDEKISMEAEKNLKYIEELKLTLKEFLKTNNISSNGTCKKCYENLTWVSRSYVSGATSCNLPDCERHFRFWCQRCKIKYCVKCAKPPTDGVCGCGVQQVLKELYSNTCDLCRNHISPKGYRCASCDYDICLGCFSGN